ncbi:hypothetical protein VR45_26740 [Streptomyces sp. NRRL S-495]|nr:hypothetical protein VR45_26740 [Streptomyces sp. NRRL S-495]
MGVQVPRLLVGDAAAPARGAVGDAVRDGVDGLEAVGTGDTDWAADEVGADDEVDAEDGGGAAAGDVPAPHAAAMQRITPVAARARIWL